VKIRNDYSGGGNFRVFLFKIDKNGNVDITSQTKNYGFGDPMIGVDDIYNRFMVFITEVLLAYVLLEAHANRLVGNVGWWFPQTHWCIYE
jgi:hypothetical protein